MRCTFLANCGILLESNGCSILIDAPNGLHTAFDGVSDAEYAKMLRSEPPYEHLCGMFFTHRHSDHYDKKRARLIEQARSDVKCYAPNGLTPPEGVVETGPFTVRYFAIGHSGEEFFDVVHRVLVVKAEGKCLYVTGDAAWDSSLHLPVLREFPPDAAVWNPNYLTHEDGRELLRTAPKNFICHLPVNVEDTYGFGRKCESTFLKYRDMLPETVLIKKYPMQFEI